MEAKDVQAVAESEAACHEFLADAGYTGSFSSTSLLVFSEAQLIAEYGVS
jgi:hypothetical protein